jgi:hypothetical protein
MIKRREFIAGLGAAAAWPFAARAQQRTNPTIGYLGSVTNDDAGAGDRDHLLRQFL